MFYFTKFLVSVLSNSWHVFLGKCMKITAMHKSKINTLHHFNYDSCWAYKLLEFSAQLIGTMLHVSTHNARLKVRVTGKVLIAEWSVHAYTTVCLCRPPHHCPADPRGQSNTKRGSMCICLIHSNKNSTPLPGLQI